jgi:hypothetical protein
VMQHAIQSLLQARLLLLLRCLPLHLHADGGQAASSRPCLHRLPCCCCCALRRLRQGCAAAGAGMCPLVQAAAGRAC